MDILAYNIKEYRKSKKLTQKDLAVLLDVAPTAISAWEVGRNKPLMDKIEQMAQIFNIKKSELLGETAPTTAPNSLIEQISDKVVQLTEPNQKSVLRYSSELLDKQERELHEAPLIEYRIYEKLSAGTGTAIYDDHSYDLAYFDKELDHDIASWIYGDSMEPKYLNGDVALIKETGFDYDGAIYAVVWDGQTYIKKVYRENYGLRLVSLNNKYSDKIAPYDEDPRIIGKIVGSFTPVER
ncbi:helix-turn-helix domain-containing protein [Streptococcus suis]|uniref:helix-turn-helix domain-containing protein n=1 Tax=Streptococcus suis TaxID=1307 RepID=UPI002FCB3261